MPRLEIQLTTPARFSELSLMARSMLMQMWNWLECNGLPFDVTDQSRYTFARLVNVDGTLGKFVGALETRDPDPLTYRWIQAIYVDPARRKIGVGTKLLLSVTGNLDVPTGLGTRAINLPMQDLAKRCGFDKTFQEYWYYPKR